LVAREASPGGRAVAELKVTAGPVPNGLELAVVTRGLRDQHPIGLAFANGVTALVRAHHLAVWPRVRGEEVPLACCDPLLLDPPQAARAQASAAQLITAPS
jgi:hypothetical protein